MLTTILFLIILAILIFVHELGHFLAAKKSGIKVDEFAVGFPPKVFSKKVGETTYSLNAIPFGGFVKIFGEDPHDEQIGESEKSRSFYYKPKYIQVFVLSAGVLMNILFGYLLISVGFMIGLPTPADSDSYGEVRNQQLVVTSVLPDSPAFKAGLHGGDTILEVKEGQDKLAVLNPEAVTELISNSKKPIEVLVQTGDAVPRQTKIVPSKDIVSDRQVIGISMDMIGTLKLPVHKAFVEGFIVTKNLLWGIVQGLTGFIIKIFSFSGGGLSDVSGPIGIANIVGEANSLGFVYLLSLVAMISLNLAVINLVPFPALDGGRILFVLIESIVGRNINPKIQTWTNVIGFGLLMLLMVLVTVKDIGRFF